MSSYPKLIGKNKKRTTIFIIKRARSRRQVTFSSATIYNREVVCNFKKKKKTNIKLKVFIAGGTGWAGSELSKGVSNNEKMELARTLSKKNKGENLADVLNLSSGNIPIFEDIETALTKTDFDVLVDYTKPYVAKKNILTSLKKGKKL